MRGTQRAPSAAAVTLALLALAPGLAHTQSIGKRGTGPATGDGEPKVTAKAAILVDAATGQVMWQRDADAVRYPASLTKIMSALLILEQGNLDDIVVVSARAGAVGESTAHLDPGDRITLHDLLVAMLLPSANDASVAAAEHVSGSLEAFVARMNERARELALSATHFVNPNGLPSPEHVSSARDLARLTQEAMKQPVFRELVALDRADITVRPRSEKAPPKRARLENHNRLLLKTNGHYWPLADGVKTGYTRAAGRCLVASATEGGWQLLCVVLGCTDSWTDARTLLEWGFARFREVEVVTEGQTSARVHVVDGSPPEVTGVARSSIDLVLPLGAPSPEVRVAESFPTAPVAAGAEVGELAVSALDGTELRATLVAQTGIRRSIWARLRDHTWEVVAIVAVLALLGALVVYGAVAEAAGARRARVAAGMRRDGPGGAGDRGRDGSAPPGPSG
jgi:serine-type D-Ala-D-Ala carboxypeptidase (penicillin-binding protein 5/6)